MKISIKVTVSDITPEERRQSKIFATRIYRPDEGEYRVIEGEMPLSEYKVLQAIQMRLERDRKNLVEWKEVDGDLIGVIEIIPAVDYTPSND